MQPGQSPHPYTGGGRLPQRNPAAAGVSARDDARTRRKMQAEKPPYMDPTCRASAWTRPIRQQLCAVQSGSKTLRHLEPTLQTTRVRIVSVFSSSEGGIGAPRSAARDVEAPLAGLLRTVASPEPLRSGVLRQVDVGPLLAPLAATVPDTSIVGFKLFSKRGLERRGHQRRQVDRDGQP